MNQLHKKRIFEGMELQYCVLSGKAPEGLEKSESYGVKVTKTQYKEDGGIISETEQINDLFYEEKDAKKFIKFLADNDVTPMALKDVAEDYIVDYFMI